MSTPSTGAPPPPAGAPPAGAGPVPAPAAPAPVTLAPLVAPPTAAGGATPAAGAPPPSIALTNNVATTIQQIGDALADLSPINPADIMAAWAARSGTPTPDQKALIQTVRAIHDLHEHAKTLHDGLEKQLQDVADPLHLTTDELKIKQARDDLERKIKDIENAVTYNLLPPGLLTLYDRSNPRTYTHATPDMKIELDPEQKLKYEQSELKQPEHKSNMLAQALENLKALMNRWATQGRLDKWIMVGVVARSAVFGFFNTLIGSPVLGMVAAGMEPKWTVTKQWLSLGQEGITDLKASAQGIYVLGHNAMVGRFGDFIIAQPLSEKQLPAEFREKLNKAYEGLEPLLPGLALEHNRSRWERYVLDQGNPGNSPTVSSPAPSGSVAATASSTTPAAPTPGAAATTLGSPATTVLGSSSTASSAAPAPTGAGVPVALGTPATPGAAAPVPGAPVPGAPVPGAPVPGAPVPGAPVPAVPVALGPSAPGPVVATPTTAPARTPSPSSTLAAIAGSPVYAAADSMTARASLVRRHSSPSLTALSTVAATSAPSLAVLAGATPANDATATQAPAPAPETPAASLTRPAPVRGGGI